MNEDVFNDSQIIEEGIKFFRVSSRLYKLSEKLVSKSKMINNSQLLKTSEKVNELASKFEDAEDLYDAGQKKEAKEKYESLIKNYYDIIKLLKKEETVNALKKIGGLGFTVAALSLPYILLHKFFPKLSISNFNNMEDASLLNKSKMYLKRAGALTLCGIPDKAAHDIFNNVTNSYDNKILMNIDKLLS